MTHTDEMAPLVVPEMRGHVAILWMADTQRRNALSVPLVEQLIAQLGASAKAGARAVVIASREKVFCAGADIKDMLANGWLEADPEGQDVVTPPDLFEAIERDGRPVLAAVGGLALGGGVELCLACDLTIASSTASFMLPELGLGVLPNTALARLPAMIGSRAAADLILSRRRIDAVEAHRLQLVNRLAEPEEVVEQAVAIAQDIVGTVPPSAFAAAKRILAKGADWPSIRSMLGQMDGQEWREGTTAFIEKRQPDYERFWADTAGEGAKE